MNELYSDKQNISAGDILRKRREELGLGLEDVSQELRIRLTFLKALEEGRIDELPGLAYASGFLRAYADFLGVNTAEILKQFRCEHQGTGYKQKLMFPAPVPQSGVPAAVVVFLGIIIIIGAYIGWYKMTDHKKVPTEVIPSIPGKVDQGKDDQGNTQLSPQIASVVPTQKPDDLQKTSSMDDTVQQVDRQAAANGQQVEQHTVDDQNSQVKAGDMNHEDDKGAAQALDNFGNMANNQTEAAPSATEEDSKSSPLAIKTTGASWIRVTDQDRHVLLEKTLPADTSWTVPQDRQNIVVTIGNAGVVVLTKDDKISQPLGKNGQVLRHLVLTPEFIGKVLPSSPHDGSDGQAVNESKPSTASDMSQDRKQGPEQDHSAAQSGKQAPAAE